MQTHFNSRSQILNNVKENTLQSYNKITQMKKAMLQHKKVLHNFLVWTMIFNENFFGSRNYLVHNWAKQRLGLVMSLIDIGATLKYHNTFVLGEVHDHNECCWLIQINSLSLSIHLPCSLSVAYVVFQNKSMYFTK